MFLSSVYCGNELSGLGGMQVFKNANVQMFEVKAPICISKCFQIQNIPPTKHQIRQCSLKKIEYFTLSGILVQWCSK